MKEYEGRKVYVTEDEDKFLNGGLEFGGVAATANGFERARAYLSRPLNKGSDERLYSFVYTVRKSGRVYKFSFTTEQVLHAVDLAEAGQTKIMQVSAKGRVEIKRSTGIEFFQTFGNPVHWELLQASSTADLRKATKAKYNAAAKGWELECRAAWKADPSTIDAWYVGSFEDQRTHDLQQACDVLIYSTMPLRKKPLQYW